MSKSVEEVDWKHIKSLIPEHLTPSQVMYQLYIKDLYTNDTGYRKKQQYASKKYYQTHLAGTDTHRNKAKEYYHKNREHILAKCKERRSKKE